MRFKTISFTCLIIAACGQLVGFAADVPENLLGVVKFPAPKTFTDKVMSIARVVQPGQQTEMLPLFMLGGFGYPNYPGISETESLSVFFFDASGDQPEMVILAKVAEDSPLRKTVEALEWVLEDRAGWLLIAKDKKAFSAVKNLAALVAINTEKADFDVTVRFYLGKEKVSQWAADFKEMIADRHTVATGGKHEVVDVAKKQRFIDFVAKGAENLNWAEFGIDLSAETISFGSVVEAVPGTPEGTLLSSPVGGAIAVAKLLSSDGMVSYQGAMSPDAILAYNDVLVERAAAMSGPQGKAWLAEYAKVIKDYLKMSDGTFAGRMAMSGGDLPEVASVSGGNYTDKAVYRLAEIAYNKLAPEFLEKVPYFAKYGVDYQFTLKKEAGKVGDISVHELTTTIKVDATTSAVQLPAGAVPADMQEKTQTYYFAVVKGLVLSAASMAEMEKLVANVQAGKPVENNVAAEFKPVEDDATQYTINIAEYVSFGLDAAAENTPEMADWADAVNKLKSANLAPATGATVIGDNRLKSSISVSVSSIAKITQVMQEEQAKQAAIQKQKEKEEKEAAAASSGGDTDAEQM